MKRRIMLLAGSLVVLAAGIAAPAPSMATTTDSCSSEQCYLDLDCLVACDHCTVDGSNTPGTCVSHPTQR